MHAPTLVLAGIISLASAQSTATLFLPGFDQQGILASVAGSDATATTYALGCALGASADSCGVPPSFTITQGPATAHFTYSVDGSFEQVDCSLGGTTTASCTVTATPVSSGSSVTSTGLSGELLASQFQIVTITDSLAAATGSAQTSDGGVLSASIPGGQSLSGVSLQTGSGQSTTAAQTSGANTASTTGGSGASSASAVTKPSTAGMSQITGNAGWTVGGVALALAVVGL